MVISLVSGVHSTTLRSSRAGDATQTFLVDGAVSGGWATGKKGKVTPFAPLPRAARREVEEEAARLEAWLR